MVVVAERPRTRGPLEERRGNKNANQVSRAPINLGYSRSFPTTLPRTRTLSTYVHSLDLLSTNVSSKAFPVYNFTFGSSFFALR